MQTTKIVIIGGPGTGKTSIINNLEEKGFTCFEEISRQVTLDAQAQGITQLFLKEPLRFSQMLLDGRIQQFKEAENHKDAVVFLDRGLPDVLAYMDYIDDTYPDSFKEACEKYKYDKVLVLSPWKDIFISDNERYENFEQALEIHQHLLETYSRFGYNLINVPFGSVEKRTQFILDTLQLH